MQSRPPRGRSKGTWFGFLKGAFGKFQAHVAGPIFGCQSHFADQTKPCLKDVSNGELRCPFCEQGKDEFWAGWLGLYKRDNGLPVGVVLQDGQFDLVEGLKYGDCVEALKTVQKFEGCAVKRVEANSYHSTLPDRQKSFDIRPQLVHMWKLPALQEWWYRQPDGKRMPTRPEPAHAEHPDYVNGGEGPYGKLTGEQKRFVANWNYVRRGAGQDPMTLDEALDKLGIASRNGDGH